MGTKAGQNVESSGKLDTIFRAAELLVAVRVRAGEWRLDG